MAKKKAKKERKVFPIGFEVYLDRANGEGERFVYDSGDTDFAVAYDKDEALRKAERHAKEFMWEWVGEENLPKEAKARYEAYVDSGMSLKYFARNYYEDAELIVGEGNINWDKYLPEDRDEDY